MQMIEGLVGSLNSGTWPNRVIALISGAGICITAVLSAYHAFGFQVPCGMPNPCASVMRSPAATLGGLPIAYLGLGAYSILFVLALGRSMTPLRSTVLDRMGLILSGIGMAYSLFLVAYSLVVVRALCPWCLISAILMSLAFASHAALIGNPMSRVPGEGWLLLSIGLCSFTIGGLQYHRLVTSNEAIPYSPTAVKQAHVSELTPAGIPLLGNRDAPIKVIMFADLTCPISRSAFLELVELIHNRNDVALFYRHFPIPSHSTSPQLARLAEAVHERGNFWRFAKKLCSEDADEKDAAVAIAVEMGIEVTAATQAWNGPSPYAWHVQMDNSLAHKLGFRHSPTIVILSADQPVLVLSARGALRKLQAIKLG